MPPPDHLTYALDEGFGFFKLREIFGWGDCEARAQAWRSASAKNALEFDKACLVCKSLDFRHGPSGLTLLGLVLTLESGRDDLDTPFLRIALARGADPNVPIDSQGRLALHRCALEGRVDAALLLIDRGADRWARPSGALSLDDLSKSGDRLARQIMRLAKEG